MTQVPSNTPAPRSCASSSAAPAPDLSAGRSPRAIIWFLAWALGVLALDLGFKSWAFEHVAGRPVILTTQAAKDVHFWEAYPHAPMNVVPHVLSLRLTTNTGAVFGLGKGSQGLFTLVSVVAVIAIGWFFWRSPARARWTQWALALMVAGALGNFYDRLRFHAVRDMLYLFPGVELPFGWSWHDGPGGRVDEIYPWIFNVADAALVVGVAMLMIILWKSDKRQQTVQTSLS